jgi:hypothetical protein
MIGKLFCYEITKKWRSSRNLLLGYAGIQIILLFVIRVFLWNQDAANALTDHAPKTGNMSLSFALTMALFFTLAAFLGAYPFLEGIYRFERDVSGKQAYLELMIPAAAWKKVLSKLLATLCSLVVCGTVSLLSFFVFFAVNTNLLRTIFQQIRINWSDIPQIALFVVFLLFSFASFYMIIFFCISIAKSFTHKNTVAVPIGILTFIIITTLIVFLTVQVDKVPLIKYTFLDIEANLSSTIEEILLFAAAMAGTSWLMEKRIEH